jgi:hypothetical protein
MDAHVNNERLGRNSVDGKSPLSAARIQLL